jgi:diadenosine tetraphosphate (Ap4A) HIT family hydrolase
MRVTENWQRQNACFACRAAQSGHSRPWFDEPLYVGPDGSIALLGVGALTEGYVIVYSPTHVTSIAQITKDTRNSFSAFACEVIEHLEDRFGPVILFEHAGCQSDDPASAACVAHAHLHIWAVGSRVELEQPSAAREFSDLSDFLSHADEFVDSPYLLSRNSEGPVYVGEGNGIPQFFRRQVAGQLGRPDEWDYAAFPEEEVMRRTQTVLLR